MGIRLELWKLQTSSEIDLVINPNYEEVGCLLFWRIFLPGRCYLYRRTTSLVYNIGPFGFGKRTGNCVCHYDLKAEAWKREVSYVEDGLWITALQLWGVIDPMMLSEKADEVLNCLGLKILCRINFNDILLMCVDWQWESLLQPIHNVNGEFGTTSKLFICDAFYLSPDRMNCLSSTRININFRVWS